VSVALRIVSDRRHGLLLSVTGSINDTIQYDIIRYNTIQYNIIKSVCSSTDAFSRHRNFGVSDAEPPAAAYPLLGRLAPCCFGAVGCAASLLVSVFCQRSSLTGSCVRSPCRAFSLASRPHDHLTRLVVGFLYDKSWCVATIVVSPKIVGAWRAHYTPVLFEQLFHSLHLHYQKLLPFQPGLHVVSQRSGPGLIFIIFVDIYCFVCKKNQIFRFFQ